MLRMPSQPNILVNFFFVTVIAVTIRVSSLKPSVTTKKEQKNAKILPGNLGRPSSFRPFEDNLANFGKKNSPEKRETEKSDYTAIFV